MNPILRARDALVLQTSALITLSDIVVDHENSYNQILQCLRGPGLSDYKGRVIITGVGKNANIATKASETMASLGIPSLYLNTGHYSHGDAGFIGPDDVLIHISRSGKTEEMIGVVKHLRRIRPGVKQILLHCNPDLNSGVLALFDYTFCTGKAVEIDEHKLAPTMSTTLLLALIDTFAINLSAERGFTPDDFLRFHPGGALGAQLRGD
ncbi:arabinose 5-phosphate isomerase [Escherichia phage EcS1]|uniref:D-arabinose 5-phosphate isomerase n=1 Tax=Escherichia phage EcS1 TaxID=2083276 RepID=A0A2Z5ZCC9_9CAUD|nr:arabinose 5-phosphate isomerase [Escherichia phage EcS1]BBC78091.1 D-arabinose 5-phosphate isomerase [Escherichia phage EcS1]